MPRYPQIIHGGYANKIIFFLDTRGYIDSDLDTIQCLPNLLRPSVFAPTYKPALAESGQILYGRYRPNTPENTASPVHIDFRVLARMLYNPLIIPLDSTVSQINFGACSIACSQHIGSRTSAAFYRWERIKKQYSIHYAECPRRESYPRKILLSYSIVFYWFNAKERDHTELTNVKWLNRGRDTPMNILHK